MAGKNLGYTDYIIIFATLIISASIGMYFRLSGGRQKTTKEYLLGDHNQRMLPVAFSLMASFMSAITLLGVSAEVYTYGTLFFIINFSYVLFAPLAAYLFLPVFFKLQATSVYEYLNSRFGWVARTCASLLYSLQMVLYMGIVVYAPALALEALTSLSSTLSIILVGTVCMFYCTLGGIKAVIWTDVFQSLLMFAAVFSVIISEAIDKGGLSPIWKAADKGGRIQLFNVNPDPTVRHTYFSLLIGGGFTFLSQYAVNQTQVQRYLTMGDLKTAVRSLWLSIPILMMLSFCTCFSGLAIYSKYQHCDPKLAGCIDAADQLMPLYVVETLGDIPGVTGLFVAGLFSASLSTVSACLNSLAAVMLEDYVKPLYIYWRGNEIPSSHCTLLSKLLALGYGLLCIAMAFLAGLFGGVLQAALSIFGMVGGPLLGIFSLGMFCPCANQPGAVTGLVTGLVVALVIGFGGPKPATPTLPLDVDGCVPNITYIEISNLTSSTTAATEQADTYFYLYRISYLYLIVISFFVTMVIGLAVSWAAFILGYSQRNLNPDLFVPPIARYLREKQTSEDMELERDLKTETNYKF